MIHRILVNDRLLYEEDVPAPYRVPQLFWEINAAQLAERQKQNSEADPLPESEGD